MAAVKKICEVCGREYETCPPIRITQPFRWQDVACCPEHGSIYFDQKFGSLYAAFLEKHGLAPVETNNKTEEDTDDSLLDDMYEYDEDEEDEYEEDDD